MLAKLWRVAGLVANVAWCSAALAASTQTVLPPSKSISDYCFAAKDWPEKGRMGSAFERKVRDIFRVDSGKIQALLYMFPQACRTDLISLSPTTGFVQLLRGLQSARKEYETTGRLSQATINSFKNQGVSQREMPAGKGGTPEWQLVISADALSQLKIRSAADLTSNGLMFIEAYHQLSRYPDFAGEQRIFLDAIERSAREIIEHSDENHNGIVGWGRLWIKERDGAILHSSVPAHNMYFGGYTYFPRTDALGHPTCERAEALQEETFDHAYINVFLLETYLVTRDRRLAEDIVNLVGKSFDDTFDDGGKAEPVEMGWYYWKQLGTRTGSVLPSCVIGREIKNTNLHMGVALRLYAEILKRNATELVKSKIVARPDRYQMRAEKVISTNDWEIFLKNNFGYQGVESRSVELAQEPSSRRLLYDRTQKEVDFQMPFFRELREIVVAGNRMTNRKTPSTAILCTGDSDTPIADVSTGSSCWNHLAFEAQDYFRLMRYQDLWGTTIAGDGRGYLDAMMRNLAAAKLVLDGRTDRFARCFPEENGGPSVGETIEIAQYGYFCMVRKILAQPAVHQMPKVHQKFLEGVSAICDSAPAESVGERTIWRRGHTFYELYLSADRLRIPAEDWALDHKHRNE